MAKNFVQDGYIIDAVAPSGGVTSGTPVVIGTLVLIPMVDAAEGETFSGASNGVWQLPCDTGLAAGAGVKWDAGQLVALASATGDVFGKLVTAESGGYADAMLVQ